jgi:SAM-dependent methyltransferase|tara:strand:+ start:1133 stop:2344 length:1212 start_codon:yes stop_codon:yes gene_type:complete
MIGLQGQIICIGCGAQALELLIDFGNQPPSNRFYGNGEIQDDYHRLAMNQCSRCALVQLVEPMAEEMVKSRVSWLDYNEPEEHLDRMVDELVSMTNLSSDSRIIGLTYKDDTILKRFNQLGYTNTIRYDLRKDYNIEDTLASLETIQMVLTKNLATDLVAKYSQADLVLARHVLEHAHAPNKFIAAVAKLLKPTGFMIFEMPDSRKFLTAYDYSFVWEEHITYFTEKTISRFVKYAGFDPWRIISYDYPFEDSLVVVARPLPVNRNVLEPTFDELSIGRAYREGFVATRDLTRAKLIQFKDNNQGVALFGAGHQGVKFLNLFNLEELIHCVIDDNPNKIGLHMPGSGMEIQSSSVLLDQHIDLCLLALSTESEKKVIAASDYFLKKGGSFKSIFSLSPIGLKT